MLENLDVDQSSYSLIMYLFLLLGLCSLSESVLESACHGLHVTHTTSSDGASASGLFIGVISNLGGRVSARRAG